LVGFEGASIGGAEFIGGKMAPFRTVKLGALNAPFQSIPRVPVQDFVGDALRFTGHRVPSPVSLCAAIVELLGA